MDWFAGVTRTNGERVACDKLRNKNVQVWYPRRQVRVIRKRHNNPYVTWIEQAAYSRYLFLYLAPNQFWLARKAKVSLVCLTPDDDTDAKHPTPIPAPMMQVLMAGFDPSGLKLEPERAKRARFKAMQQVRYPPDHPYHDLLVRVVEDDGGDIIRVMLTIFGRPHPASVHAAELQAA